jgi:hypothetical protein
MRILLRLHPRVPAGTVPRSIFTFNGEYHRMRIHGKMPKLQTMEEATLACTASF